MKSSHAFWWAAFGSVLPQVVRFAAIIDHGQALPALSWILYFAIQIVLSVSAGVFSIGWKPKNSFQAMWVGASFPTLVGTLIQAAPKFGG